MARIKEVLLLTTLSSQNSSSPRLSPGKLLLLGWSFYTFFLLVWVLQVITPDGQIYSASRFTTRVPWTRTRRTNAVSLSAGGFFNFYMAAVSVCVCLFSLWCVCSPAGLSRELLLHSDRRGVCGGQLARCSAAFSKCDLAVRVLFLWSHDPTPSFCMLVVTPDRWRFIQLLFIVCVRLMWCSTVFVLGHYGAIKFKLCLILYLLNTPS